MLAYIYYMQVFKFFILILVFLGSSYIGILISKRYSARTEELKQIKTALNMLKTKIRFTYEPLSNIFEQISKSLSNNISEIFICTNENMKKWSVKEAWEYSIDCCKLSLNKEDKRVLKELGNLLRKNRCRRTS